MEAVKAHSFDAVSSLQRGLERQLLLSQDDSAPVYGQDFVPPLSGSRYARPFQEAVASIFERELARVEQALCRRAWGLTPDADDKKATAIPSKLRWTIEALEDPIARWRDAPDSARDFQVRRVTAKSARAIQAAQLTVRETCDHHVHTYAPQAAAVAQRTRLRLDLETLQDMLARAGAAGIDLGSTAACVDVSLGELQLRLRQWARGADPILAQRTETLAQRARGADPRVEYADALRSCVAVIDRQRRVADAAAQAGDECMRTQLPEGCQERMVGAVTALRLY